MGLKFIMHLYNAFFFIIAYPAIRETALKKVYFDSVHAIRTVWSQFIMKSVTPNQIYVYNHCSKVPEVQQGFRYNLALR